MLAHLCVFPVMLKQHLRGMRSGQVRSRVKFSMEIQYSRVKFSMLKQHLRGMRSGQVRSRVKFSMKKSRISNIFHSPTLQEILGVVEALGVREK